MTVPIPAGTPHPKLDELIAVTARLRAPGGCAWDAEQTHASLVQYLVEEAFELVDAIEGGDREEMIEELGDVLYQVLFHTDIAAATDGERFTIEDVAEHMTAKMVGRHPHVFGDQTAATADEVVGLWDRQKAIEKPHRTSVLDGVPLGMPSLALADKLLGRAKRVGIAVDAAVEVSATQASVTQAPATEVPVAEAPATEEELGDLLLTLVSTARAQGLDAERALRSRLRVLQQDIRDAERH